MSPVIDVVLIVSSSKVHDTRTLMEYTAKNWEYPHLNMVESMYKNCATQSRLHLFISRVYVGMPNSV